MLNPLAYPHNFLFPQSFYSSFYQNHLYEHALRTPDYFSVYLMDLHEFIELINVPTLLLTGDVSHATTLECAAWMQEVIGDCKWVRFSAEEYGAHSFCQTAYKKFNREVREFLK